MIRRIFNTRMVIVALWGWISAAILFALFFIPFRWLSESQLNTWAKYAGGLQAEVWFKENHYRLLELSTNSKTQFTGRKDDQFEVWTWPYYTNTSWLTVGNPDRVFVTAFNNRMRQLCDKKGSATEQTH